MEPMEIAPVGVVHVVAAGSDADEVDVEVKSTTIGSQSSSSGHGDWSLGGKELPGIAPCGYIVTVQVFGTCSAQSGGGMGFARPSRRL